MAHKIHFKQPWVKTMLHLMNWDLEKEKHRVLKAKCLSFSFLQQQNFSLKISINSSYISIQVVCHIILDSLKLNYLDKKWIQLLILVIRVIQLLVM